MSVRLARIDLEGAPGGGPRVQKEVRADRARREERRTGQGLRGKERGRAPAGWPPEKSRSLSSTASSPPAASAFPWPRCSSRAPFRYSSLASGSTRAASARRACSSGVTLTWICARDGSRDLPLETQHVADSRARKLSAHTCSVRRSSMSCAVIRTRSPDAEHRSLDDRVDTRAPARPAKAASRLLVVHDGGAGDHRRRAQLASSVIRASVIPSAKNSCSGSAGEVVERQDRRGNGSGEALARGGLGGDGGIATHRRGNRERPRRGHEPRGTGSFSSPDRWSLARSVVASHAVAGRQPAVTPEPEGVARRAVAGVAVLFRHCSSRPASAGGRRERASSQAPRREDAARRPAGWRPETPASPASIS